MGSSRDEETANCIRCLSADAVQRAKSGHPGAPMGMAPVAYVLWSEVLKYCCKDPNWINRDRFVLSNGHASILQYIMLHLTGYDVTVDDLKEFRQLSSRTPGHPERGVTPGVEVTTGPLGQGIGAGVGLAIAEAQLAATYNRPDFDVIDHWTYVFCGDGCLMEGVSQEALSLAGHLGLEKLVVVYDSNNITIDGSTDLAFTEDTVKKYEALGFHIIEVASGDTDFASLRKAFTECKTVKGRPKMMIVRTTIGFGSHVAGTEKVHGAPLGEDDIAQLKQKFGCTSGEKFSIGQGVYDTFKKHADEGKRKQEEWNKLLDRYAAQHPTEAVALRAQLEGVLPDGWKSVLPLNDKPIATRKASENVLAALLPIIPSLFGGSADLSASNLTRPGSACLVDFQKDTPHGRYLRFGVREHAMCAIMNGIHAHGGFIPYGGTFLNFVAYALGAIRLSSLSHHHVVLVATHDSIGVGEDGPTHQPVELLALLRATPNLLVFRPSDQTETSGAWLVALEHSRTPSILCLSRQTTVPQQGSSIQGVARGGYLLLPVSDPQLVIITSGSEVSLAVEAAKLLLSELRVAVVSMPCQELFDQQTLDYQREVIPDGVPVLSVEPYVNAGWEKYSHYHVGMNDFGASAPAGALYQHFNITVEHIVDAGRKLAAKFSGGLAPLKRIHL
ncbi:Transketolase thiamine diphosphate binding domain [Trypanosoma vivax]|uniref:Transketolase n=1 Tax=Trypanosoma vivax (strain Y486) TaxID=1055687 RepID=G0U1L2_TRYVY|nr:putative transketolase [Trypanosoma vivax]KAH8616970.1 Transketolase thiamine diphosphate binding domain [Trypanosoma vivax]CCC49969.1 putative transketolase [Trypanosoma vivax Y486]